MKKDKMLGAMFARIGSTPNLRRSCCLNDRTGNMR